MIDDHDPFLSALDAGLLIRHQWHADDYVCLLLALAPECRTEEGGDPSRCLAEHAPLEWAYLTPWIDDSGSAAVWPSMVREYAEVTRLLVAMPREQQMRLNYTWRSIIVREAMRHTQATSTLTICERVVALCDRTARGDAVTTTEWAEAVREAAAAAQRRSGLSPAVAAVAAWAANVARAAAAAAEAGAAATWATWAARAAAKVRATTVRAAGEAAADRMTSTIFDAIRAAQ